MAIRFDSKRMTDTRKVNTGADSYTVSVEFVPNFIMVRFTDIKNKAPDISTPDSVTWDAATTATGYDLTINYVCNEPREIKVVAAVTPVDVEGTISF